MLQTFVQSFQHAEIQCFTKKWAQGDLLANGRVCSNLNKKEKLESPDKAWPAAVFAGHVPVGLVWIFKRNRSFSIWIFYFRTSFSIWIFSCDHI
jgi:hypothetical protein